MRNRKRNKREKFPAVDANELAQSIIFEAYSSGMLNDRHVYKIDVLHGEGCSFETGLCNCKPLLRIMDLSGEASWDLSKKPKGVRAKEADISVIRHGSNLVN